MENIIYCRYSNDRGDKFNIKTTITLDENNSKKVYKEAFTKDAIEHVENIYKSYKLLSENYNGNNIFVNKCEKKTGKLQFEYLEGKTLENVLDELREKKDYYSLIEKIREYVKVLFDVNKKTTFSMTQEFVEIFGDVKLPANLQCGFVNNIDLIFGNIMLLNNKWNIIDYEWTFNFPIPFNFIIYRSIYYYVHGSTSRNDLISLDLYKVLGISTEEIVEYEKMERNFQRYILGSHTSLWTLYEKMGKKNISIDEMILKIENNKKDNRAQVFFDNGEGYSEENSYFCNSEKESTRYDIIIPIDKKIKKLRIDPLEDYCIVKIDKIVRMGRFCKEVAYYTNGIQMDENTIIFNTTDPQIIIEDIESEVTDIFEIQFEVSNLKFEVLQKILSLFGEKKELADNVKQLEDVENKLKENIQKLESEIGTKENYINELKSSICDLNNTIASIENTKTWKMHGKVQKIFKGTYKRKE